MSSEIKDFHDLSWTISGGKPQLKALTPDGIENFDFPMKPYCYVREEDVTKEVLRTIGKVDESAHLYPYEDYHQGALKRIEVANPRCISKLKDELEIELLQSDIPYSRRVMIDQDWSVSPTEDVLVFDIEVAAPSGVPDPDEANNRILTICGVDSSGKEYVWAEDSERLTLEKFFETAYEKKAIMGWNSLGFDKPYIENRADELGVEYDPFRYVHIDALPIYRDVLLVSQNSYGLENVVDEEFEEDFYQFEDVDYSELEDYFWNDRDRLIEYNLEDVNVLKKLADRYQFKDLLFDVLAGQGYCCPEDIFYLQDEGGYKKTKKSATVLVEGIIINESTVRSPESPVIWPNKYQGEGEEKFQGAKVLEPVPGRHENVVLLDFSSMYPGIIEALNVGPETYREDGSGDIDAPIGSFVSEPESKFSRAYRRAQKTRNEWKEKKKNREQGTPEWYVASAYDSGLKARTNTFYGVIGSRYSRFYNKDVAENITRMGQRMITKTQELADNYGLQVIYGDTDSVIIQMPEGTDDLVDKGKDIAELFTNNLKSWIEQEYNADSSLVELTLDEVYESFFITDKKKRYAGRCVWAGSPCNDFNITGFETVRGDTMTAVQDFQEILLRRIVAGDDAYDVVSDHKRELMSGELDEKIIKRIGLSKPIEAYKSTPPHVRVAKNNDLEVGEAVPYLKYGKDPKDVVYAGDEDYKKYLSQTAYRYIWENNFQSIVDRLGIEKYEQTGLGNFQ